MLNGKQEALYNKANILLVEDPLFLTTNFPVTFVLPYSSFARIDGKIHIVFLFGEPLVFNLVLIKTEKLWRVRIRTTVMDTCTIVHASKISSVHSNYRLINIRSISALLDSAFDDELRNFSCFSSSSFFFMTIIFAPTIEQTAFWRLYNNPSMLLCSYAAWKSISTFDPLCSTVLNHQAMRRQQFLQSSHKIPWKLTVALSSIPPSLEPPEKFMEMNNMTRFNFFWLRDGRRLLSSEIQVSQTLMFFSIKFCDTSMNIPIYP